MRRFRARGKLRLEQRRHEKPVIWQFHGAWLATSSACAHAQSGGLELAFVVPIHAVITEVLFGPVFFTGANRIQERVRQNRQPFSAGTFRTIRAAVRKRAGQRCDDAVWRAGVVFSGIGVGNVQDVARILYQSILKAPSRADERPIARARELDAAEHPFETLVRAPWRCDQPITTLEHAFAVCVVELRSGQPTDFDRNPEGSGGVIERGVGGEMRVIRRFEIADDAYSDAGCHGRHGDRTALQACSQYAGDARANPPTVHA